MVCPALRKFCRVIREYNSDTGLDCASVQEAMGSICLTKGEIQQATSHFQKAMRIILLFAFFMTQGLTWKMVDWLNHNAQWNGKNLFSLSN